MLPAIILSSHTMGLGVIRALGQMGVRSVVFYHEERDAGYVSKYVQERHLVPHPEYHQDEFISALLDHAPRLAGCPMFPTSDAALSAVSRHMDALKPHYKLGFTEWAITELFLDKKHTYALADANGVPAPKTIVPQSVAEAEQFARQIEFPCLVKPCQSHLYYAVFKQKMVQVETARQMIQVYLEAARAGLDVILQEIIPGGDDCGVNYNAYFWDGEPLVEFTAQKVRNAPPTFGSPRVIVSKAIPEVIEPGRKILQAMGFYGYACTEFKRDPRDGVYKLMEVNGRHNLSTLLAVKCGINFPWLHYQHLVNGTLPQAGEFRAGVYWIDLLRDVGYSVKSFRQEHYRVSQYMRPYLKPHVFAILSLRDPKPFMRRVSGLLRPGTARAQAGDARS